MIERILLLALLGAVGLGLFHLLRLTHLRHIQTDLPPLAVPRLLYFRSDTCAACGTQKRYIDQLASGNESHLVIETINADKEQARSRQYGVLTLPMTIWLDRNGQARQVNYGLTEVTKLERQLNSLIAVPPSTQRE